MWLRLAISLFFPTCFSLQMKSHFATNEGITDADTVFDTKKNPKKDLGKSKT